MNNYKELKVWQKSMDLTAMIYKISKLLPQEETYGLKSQMLRSATSVPSNIAEGAGRNSNKEFRNFLGFANGSLNELNTQILLCIRIKYLDKSEADEMIKSITEISKMLYSLIQKFS
ncbi:MAG: four helix bundle protein [Bacteroidota bacterium]